MGSIPSVSIERSHLLRTAFGAMIAIVFLNQFALAQYGAPVNAEVCFSDLLQNHYDFNENVDLKYRLLSLWDRQLYEDSKMNSAMYTAYGMGNLDASQAKVVRELQMQNQSIDYNRATAVHVARLDPQASAIINHCLDRLTSGFGAFSTIEREDERYIDLTISWRDTSGRPLKFKKQEIFNGYVLDDNKTHPTVPFLSAGWYSDPEIPSGSSRSIRVERTGPYQRVIFNFVVSPEIGFKSIHVDPVPERVTYRQIPVGKNLLSGLPLHSEWVAQTWVNNNGLVQTWDDGNGHKHYRMDHDISEVDQDPTAVFTSVICEKYGAPSDFADLDGANPPWASIAVGQGAGTRKATCYGWWQNTGRSIIMKADYQLTGFEPVSHTWQPWYPAGQNK